MVVDLEDLSETGSDVALLIPPGMVAVSIPINRLSSVSYALERGDHVNVIVTLLFVDLDANFQTILPNNTAAVIAPGPNVLVSSESVLGSESSGTDGETSVQAKGQSATLTLDELLQTLTAQSASGGGLSPVGRLEIDQSLSQPFYIVPSERQRPRLVSQTLIENVVVLQLGNFEDEVLLPDAADAPEDGTVPADQGTTGTEAAAAVPNPPDIITLIVSPQDAVTLNYLLYTGGQISLAMRSSQDDSRADTEAVTLNFLLDQYRLQVPVKLPFGLEPRIDDLTQPVLPNDFVPPPQQ
jgi:pilus assembly protein CpaB